MSRCQGIGTFSDEVLRRRACLIRVRFLVVSKKFCLKVHFMCEKTRGIAELDKKHAPSAPRCVLSIGPSWGMDIVPPSPYTLEKSSSRAGISLPEVGGDSAQGGITSPVWLVKCSQVLFSLPLARMACQSPCGQTSCPFLSGRFCVQCTAHVGGGFYSINQVSPKRQTFLKRDISSLGVA